MEKPFEIECVETGMKLVLTGEAPLSMYEDEAYADSFFSYRAAIVSEAVKVDIKVADRAPKLWVGFFENLAATWDGWEAAKAIESLEGHLAISCTTDALGHVEMRVTVQDLGASWICRVTLHVEAGQLEDIAKRSRMFFL